MSLSWVTRPLVAIILFCLLSSAHAEPLPSWNESAAKSAIVALVDRVTDPRSADYVPPSERIAAFDNDGTLWVEQPAPAQGSGQDAAGLHV